MEFPHRVIDVTSERRTRGKFGLTTNDEETKRFHYLSSELQMRYSDISNKQADQHFVISMDIKLLFVRFDFLLSYHGNQLRSFLDGQPSLPGFSSQLLVDWLVD